MFPINPSLDMVQRTWRMKLDALLGCLTFCRQLDGLHYCFEHIIMEIEVSGLSTLQHVLAQYNLYEWFYYTVYAASSCLFPGR